MKKNSRLVAWAFLLVAIVLEVCSASMLEYSQNALWGKFAVLVLISFSYFFMSLTLRQIPLGVAYAVWEVVGLIGVLLVSFVLFDIKLNFQQYLGIALGFAGVLCVSFGEKDEEDSSENLSQNLTQKAREV